MTFGSFTQWLDNGGRLRVVTINGTIDSLDTVVDAMSDISNANPLRFFQGEVAIGTGITSSAVYADVADEADMIFATLSGSLVTIVLPAPLNAIFLSDQVTVDSTEAGVNAFIEAVLTCPVSTLDGEPVTSFVAGIRKRRGATIYHQ